MDGGIDGKKAGEKEQEEERRLGSNTPALAAVGWLGGCARQQSAGMGSGSGNHGVVE